MRAIQGLNLQKRKASLLDLLHAFVVLDLGACTLDLCLIVGRLKRIVFKKTFKKEKSVY